MEVLILFNDDEIKFFALSNVGATALRNLVKYFVTKQTFTDEATKTSMITSSDPGTALSEYLTIRPEHVRNFRIDLEGRYTVYEDIFKFTLREKIIIDELDNSTLEGLLQHMPDFPTCLATHRSDTLRCKYECFTRCCDSCDHVCPTCKDVKCISLLCCLDNSTTDCNHECASCKHSYTKCKERFVVCCERCKTCLGCKEKNAADLCPNEQLRGFVSTILKAREFSFRLRSSKTDTNTFQSDDFPDCTKLEYIFNHIRKNIEGLLKYLLDVKQISQIEYDDEIDRIFEVDIIQRRELIHDHFVELLNELESFHVYRTIKSRFWPHIAHLRERRHYLTLIARKKNWLTQKYEDWPTRDVGLFGGVASKVYAQVKSIFEEKLGTENYKVFPIRCSFKDKYVYPQSNFRIDVLISIQPSDGKNELPEYLHNAQSDKSRKIWKSASEFISRNLEEQLHVKTSQILTRWDHSESSILYLQTVVTRKTGGEFSPWEEVIVMNTVKNEIIRGMKTSNVSVKKLPQTQMRRDSVKLQFQIDTKNEDMLDRVNKILHHAGDYDFLKI